MVDGLWRRVVYKLQVLVYFHEILLSMHNGYVHLSMVSVEVQTEQRSVLYLRRISVVLVLHHLYLVRGLISGHVHELMGGQLILVQQKLLFLLQEVLLHRYVM